MSKDKNLESSEEALSMTQLMVASMKAVAVEMRSDQVNILKVRPKLFPDSLSIRWERYLKVLN